MADFFTRYNLTMLYSTIIMLFVVHRLMGAFFDTRRTPVWALIASYLYYYIAPNTIFLIVPPSMYTHIAIDATSLFIVTLNYKSTMLRRMIATVFILFFIAFINVFHMLLYEPFIAPMPGWEFHVIHIIYFSILPLMVASMLRKIKFIKQHQIPSSSLWVYVSQLIVTFILFVMFLATIHNSEYLPRYFVFIIVGLGLLINILIYTLHYTMTVAHDRKLKSALYAQEKDYYLSQSKLMQESVEKIKAIRHDMKMHLSTVREYAADNMAVTDYLNRLLGDIGETEPYSNTGNTAIDSIINYKLRDIGESGFKPSVKITLPPNINLEAVDVVTILGNLLDNALDATMKLPDNKMLRLNVRYANDGIIIKIENTFDGNLKYTNGKTEADKQIATLKTEDGHGYGLKNIRQAVERYNGDMKIEITGDIFAVRVFLYLNFDEPTS